METSINKTAGVRVGGVLIIDLAVQGCTPK